MTQPEFVFKNRGLLLVLPAAALAIFGRPSAASIALGLPLALAGELIRCWAVGYSGVTTRNDAVTAPKLVTGGPYGYVRNPLYIGNFITAAGFAIAFTGRNLWAAHWALVGGSLAAMAAVYAIIVPHEEAFLRSKFGAAFERYCERVPRLIPRLNPLREDPSTSSGQATWDARALIAAESKTFALFGAMLAVLVVKARGA
ncbi:MAG TPA: isoprenylcysteine carboxylmethyltransferase family protein [Candidatus Cybelea sp.]